MIRSVLLPLGLAAGFALSVVSCGPTTVRCQPSNCSGCCSESGECLGPTKQSDKACGAQGAACRVCLPGQFCSQGRCLVDPDAGLGGGAGGGGDTAGGAGGGGGSTGGGSGGGGSTPCGGNGDMCCNGTVCYLGLTCQRGTCLPPPMDAGTCGANGQVCCAGNTCTLPLVCNAGICGNAPVDAGQPKRTGEPCLNDGECLDGLCLVFGFQGGYCTKACSTSADCFAGSQCGANPSGAGPARVCLAQCSQPGQAPGGCRPAYVCDRNADTMGVPVCLPACANVTMCRTEPRCDTRGFCCGSTGAACCEGTTCEGANTCMNGYCQATACGAVGQPCCATAPACTGNAVCQGNQCVPCGTVGQPCCAGNSCTSGTCTSGTCQNPSLQPTGGPCTKHADCQGGECLVGTNGLWTGGYCSQDCAATPCAAGSNCSPYVIAGRSLCVQACAYDGGQSTCRSGYVCDRFLIPGNYAQGSCNTACTTGTQCPSGRCEAGFCCGSPGFKCCSGSTCPAEGTCGALGYCQ
jgi:hypothetical protein